MTQVEKMHLGQRFHRHIELFDQPLDLIDGFSPTDEQECIGCFQRDHTESQKELARVRKELASARSEGVRWKKVAGGLEEKVKAGAMAHAELQQFRGELQGAIKEFQALKGDFGKARSELSDPIERAGLKKSVNGLERERERLQNEIEIALKERTGLREQLARQKEEAERKEAEDAAGGDDDAADDADEEMNVDKDEL